MTPEQKQRIILSQRDAFKRNGYHPHALFWSSREVQEVRFKIIADIGIGANANANGRDSILDVGCGFGDFAAYLERQNISTSYTGIDISADLLAEGRRQYPDLKLLQADLFEFDPKPQSFDYVTLSGTLNRKFMGNNGAQSAKDYSLEVIKRMFASCKKGIAFNLLDARHQWTADRWDLQSFYPDEILQVIKQLTRNYRLIDTYLENDFTIHAWRV